MIAKLLETLVVDAAAAVADFDELREALELGVGVALHAGADERERLQIFQPGEFFQAGVGELAVVGEAKRLEILQSADRSDPLVVEFGGNDVERLQRSEFADVLEERRFFEAIASPRLRPFD